MAGPHPRAKGAGFDCPWHEGHCLAMLAALGGGGHDACGVKVGQAICDVRFFG